MEVLCELQCCFKGRGLNLCTSYDYERNDLDRHLEGGYA